MRCITDITNFHTNVQDPLPSTTHLQLKKEPLQLTRDVLRRFFLTALKLPLIKGIAELWSHEESLQQTVKVTSHGLVHQPYKTYGRIRKRKSANTGERCELLGYGQETCDRVIQQSGALPSYLHQSGKF
ncbi:hypothetical protein E2C01_003966 [Portunus trituberculatus]|uniref:Uncharacterized protein n=1 Tax=Portunus trituberculatus TaxID=210409 RepID=A0A5B7CRL2_PORTR|nr:hypothetical protein [Portunus trituberculatus]